MEIPQIETLKYENNEVKIIDQTLLPNEYKIVTVKDHLEMADYIKRLSIRGAPAIGIAGAFGIYLGVKGLGNLSYDDFLKEFYKVKEILVTTRPTAVNLGWACEEVEKEVLDSGEKDPKKIIELILETAKHIMADDLERSRKIGTYGDSLIEEGYTIITHCNAGGLATSGIGTALAPMFVAHANGKNIKVFADETRPLLQGSRLTAWELQKVGIDVTVICDNMSAWTMKKSKVDMVITGADRIALNGDTANKIGTYLLAIAAKEHNVPFYVAAPISTFDPKLPSGDEIPIEIRGDEEVVCGFGKRTAPENIKVFSPAFDVTPSKLIKGIITEKGIIYPPFIENIKKAL